MSNLFALYLYFGVGLAALACLSTMILLIGRDLATCPVRGRALRVGSISTATGFAAIGLGGLILAVPAVTLFAESATGLFIALGLVLIALGLGFTNAVAILRGLTRDAGAAAQ